MFSTSADFPEDNLLTIHTHKKKIFLLFTLLFTLHDGADCRPSQLFIPDNQLEEGRRKKKTQKTNFSSHLLGFNAKIMWGFEL
jgi:hypothetical protein